MTPSDTETNTHIVEIHSTTARDMSEGVMSIAASNEFVSFYTTDHRCYVYKYDSLGNAAEGWDLEKVKVSADTVGTAVPKDLGKSDDNRLLKLDISVDNIVVAPGGNGEVEYFKEGEGGKWTGGKCRGGRE